MNFLIVAALVLVVVAAAAVVFTDDPARQAVTLSILGVLLTVLFVVMQAPDVALSQLAIGSAIVPLMVLLAIRKVREPQAPTRRVGPERDA